MLKRKIICLFCALSIMLGITAFDVSAGKIPAECHGELVSYILPGFAAEEGNVTRGEFVKYLVQLRYGEKADGISEFKDVDEYSDASGEINYAREIGIIDSAEMFYPDLPITLNQAEKVAVNLLGYKKMAELRGGYPSGYAQTAAELELFSDVALEKYITWTSFSEIIYNILNAPLISVEINANDVSYAIDENANLLNTKYEIYEFSGIETANYLTSLTEPEGKCKEGSVKIGSEEYLYNGTDYLGYNVSGFYRDNDGEKEIITMRPERNEEITLKTGDIKHFDSHSVSYNTETKIKSEDIYPGYSFIYNHKAYKNTDIADLIMNSDAELTFIDADGDSKYETIKMIKKDYLVVKNVNTFDMLISGNDFEKGVINLDSEVIYKITKNNTNASIHDIAVGDLLCYTVSEDLLYYEINSVYNEISGKISGINKEDNIIKISDEEYSYNSYFKKHYESFAPIGTDVVLLLDDEGKICCIAEKNNAYFYGWIMKKWNDESTDRYCLKIFTESGTVKNYKLADAVSFDGVKVSALDAIEQKLDLTSDEKRFVRYFVDGNEEITKIDFSENASGGLPFNEKKKENDYLTCFYEDTTSTYLSSGKLFSNLCKLSDSCKIFIIPESDDKRNDEANYLAVSSGYFSNNVSYTVNVYDIDEVNGAEAIVIFDDRNSLATEAASAVVESVEMTLNEDDNVIYLVSLLKDGTFMTLETTEDTAEKAGKLNPGDIIRYSKSTDNKLLSFNLEYDCKNNLLLAQDSNQVKYRKGFVFSYNNGYTTILEKDSLSGYTYKDMSFTYFGNIKPSHIYLTLNSDGSVRKAMVRNQPDSTIKSYRSVGSVCDRIITRSRFEALNSVWIYHIEY